MDEGMRRNVIAERKLLFSKKGESDRQPLAIRIYAPRSVDPAAVNFPVDANTASCVFELDGIPNSGDGEIYGADSLQALQLAVDIEPVLKRLSEQYDFYFLTGEDYFER